jgi:hypothetical protein
MIIHLIESTIVVDSDFIVFTQHFSYDFTLRFYHDFLTYHYDFSYDFTLRFYHDSLTYHRDFIIIIAIGLALTSK